jgi:hypothetical protein
MGSAGNIASDFFGIGVHVIDDDGERWTAQAAEAAHIKSSAKIDAAMLLMRELYFRLDEDSNHTREASQAYVQGAMALLCLSDASTDAVQRFISDQLRHEWKMERDGAVAHSEGRAATHPAGHA